MADVRALSEGGSDAKDGGRPRPSCDHEIEPRAHGAQTLDDATPFTAPSGGDHYEIFWFAPSWSDTVHVIEVEALADNTIARTWLLLVVREHKRRAALR